MGPVEKKLQEEISKRGTLCFALLDSEELSPEKAADIALRSQACGVSAILVGGSTTIDQIEMNSVLESIKNAISLPVILFPGNVTGVSPRADAIFFSCLLNSDNPYFMTQAQALSALTVRKYHLETLPMGYIIIGEGGAVGFVGRARGIPPYKPSLAAMYALAAQYLGMRFVYLEAGSGVTSHVPPAVAKAVRSVCTEIVMVGGGIRTAKEATELSASGADVIVVGTLLESPNFEPELRKIVRSIQRPLRT